MSSNPVTLGSLSIRGDDRGGQSVADRLSNVASHLGCSLKVTPVGQPRRVGPTPTPSSLEVSLKEIGSYVQYLDSLLDGS